MALKKKDFIEINFTGRVKDTGEIFDSNIKKDLEISKLQQDAKPFIFCLGEGMFLKAIDDFLVGKNIGDYNLDLEPEQAFGKRDSKQVQIMPLKIFTQQKLNPVPGIMFNFDGRVAKILSVSGGRVIVDFNNPLAGKPVKYEIKVLRKIEDEKEKISSFINFLFRKDLKFSIQDKKIILEVEKQMAKFVEMFSDKFKDIFGKELEVRETKGPN